MSKALFAVLSLVFAASNAVALEGDLILPDAFAAARFDRLVCGSFDEAGIAAPSSLQGREVRIEGLRADRMLIQFLITAEFAEAGETCRYSALFTRGRRNSVVLTQSKAFAPEHDHDHDHFSPTDCEPGRKSLDLLLAKLPFDYTGSPIRFISLKITDDSAAEVCGAGAKNFRLVFERVR